MSAIPLALAAASGLAKAKMKEAKTSAAFGVGAVLTASVSAIFLLVAVTILLTEAIGGAYACLVMSSLFLVAAIVLLVLRARRTQRLKKTASIETMLLKSALTGSNVSFLLPLGALVAGIVMASNSGSDSD